MAKKYIFVCDDPTWRPAKRREWIFNQNATKVDGSDVFLYRKKALPGRYLIFRRVPADGGKLMLKLLQQRGLMKDQIDEKLRRG